MGNLNRHHYSLCRAELLHPPLVDLMYRVWFSAQVGSSVPRYSQEPWVLARGHHPKVVGEEARPKLAYVEP